MSPLPCWRGLYPPLLPSSLPVSWTGALPAGRPQASQAGLPYPFPEECSPARLLLGKPGPLLPSSICNHYLFIFGSLRNQSLQLGGLWSQGGRVRRGQCLPPGTGPPPAQATVVLGKQVVSTWVPLVAAGAGGGQSCPSPGNWTFSSTERLPGRETMLRGETEGALWHTQHHQH